jgi:polysaccharide export outer membrane protein
MTRFVIRLLVATVGLIFAMGTLWEELARAQATGPLTPPVATLGPVQDLPSNYTLRADDQVTIHALDAEEISEKPVRIATNGTIELPYIGRVHAAGLTVEQLEEELNTRLKVYIKDPQVSVTVGEMHSQPVSILGSVMTPGVHQLQGKRTLIEMLSVAGGTRPDAGYRVKITRSLEWGPVPLPGAVTDASGQFSVAELNLRDIIEARDPTQNILIMPNDVISVPRAEMVFVIGDVNRQGSIVLGDEKTVSLLQSLSIAGGLAKTAKATEAKIMRVQPGSADRFEIAVNLKAMLAGKVGDLRLQANDILFVPNSLRKDLAYKTLDAMAGTALTSVLYRVP